VSVDEAEVVHLLNEVEGHRKRAGEYVNGVVERDDALGLYAAQKAENDALRARLETAEGLLRRAFDEAACDAPTRDTYDALEAFLSDGGEEGGNGG
jgi:hypothetical protein